MSRALGLHVFAMVLSKQDPPFSLSASQTGTTDSYYAPTMCWHFYIGALIQPSHSPVTINVLILQIGKLRSYNGK